jgi:hypothetical protein
MPDPTRADPTRGARPACPICGRPAEPKQRPFCSIRCADADLGRWLTGQYRVPGPPVDPDEPLAGGGSSQRSADGRLDPEDGLG